MLWSLPFISAVFLCAGRPCCYTPLFALILALPTVTFLACREPSGTNIPALFLLEGHLFQHIPHCLKQKSCVFSRNE